MLDNDDDLVVPDVPLARVDDDGDDGCSTPLKTLHAKLEVSADASSQKSAENGTSALSANFAGNNTIDNGTSGNLSVSLENLVEHFDANISKVLTNLDANTQTMAPVQVRSHDEVMSESQVWWTLTGNYGNCPPLDFNKMQIRKNQLDALNLRPPPKLRGNSSSRSYEDAGYGGGCADEDDDVDEEELRDALDLHQLISEHVCVEVGAPPVSAEQVIEEIDEMMQACDMMHCSISGANSMVPPLTERTTITTATTATTMDGCSVDSMYSSMRSPFTTTMSSQSAENDDLKMKHSAALSLTSDELNCLPQSKLIAISSEMEQLIQAYNKDLVNELAHRDELEYEKEVKNRFITLLLNVQDQRRKVVGENARRKSSSTAKSAASTPGSQLTTASIPFDETQSMLNVDMLESLTRILQAIGEDSPNVPNLLTEYILTVVCPSTTTSMIA